MDIQKTLYITDLRRLMGLMPPEIRRSVTALFVLMVFLAFMEVCTIFSISFMAMTVTMQKGAAAKPMVRLLLDLCPAAATIFDNPREGLFIAGCAVFGCVLVRNALAALTTWKASLAGEAVSTHAADTLYSYFIRKFYKWHLSPASAKISGALSRRNALAGLLVHILTLYTYFLTSAALFILILSQTPSLIFVCLFLIGGVAYLTQRALRTLVDRAGREVNEANAEAKTVTATTAKGMREIILCRLQSVLRETYLAALRRATRPKAVLVTAPRIPAFVLETFGFLTIPVTVGVLIYIEKADMADVAHVVTTIILIAWRVLPLFNKSMSSIVKLRALRPDAKICLDGLDLVQRKGMPAHPAPDPDYKFSKTLELRHASFRYPEAPSDSVTDVGIKVRKGEQVGIVGVSGSGKTTIADLFAGILRPYTGSVRTDGKKMKAPQRTALLDRLGYVEQAPCILKGTIAQNVALRDWGKPIDRERVLEACRKAALTLIEESELGIDQPIGGAASGLSGGQAQRVSIARALYGRPELLILDESTSALDLGTENSIMETLEALRGTLTVIIVAHRLTTLRGCDRIIWIENGRVRTQGTPDEILPAYEQELLRHDTGIAQADGETPLPSPEPAQDPQPRSDAEADTSPASENKV